LPAGLALVFNPDPNVELLGMFLGLGTFALGTVLFERALMCAGSCLADDAANKQNRADTIQFYVASSSTLLLGGVLLASLGALPCLVELAIPAIVILIIALAEYLGNSRLAYALVLLLLVPVIFLWVFISLAILEFIVPITHTQQVLLSGAVVIVLFACQGYKWVHSGQNQGNA
jgi:hypothetical protein